MSTETETYSSSGMTSLDILAATFFVVAGAWLIIALLYSFLVIVFLRLRARGELGSIYDEDFGRVYLCGSTRYYISFGGVFRRYIRHIQPEPSPGESAIQAVKFMTRAERREAMEILLNGDTVNKRPVIIKSDETKSSSVDADVEVGKEASLFDGIDSHGDLDSSQDPVCSICLAEYESHDQILRSRTCCHEFHKECIMDWLQRQINTECPCCRSPMVNEEDVWVTVKNQRKLRKRVSRHQKLSKALRKNDNNLDLSEMIMEDGCATGSPSSRDTETDVSLADPYERSA